MFGRVMRAGELTGAAWEMKLVRAQKAAVMSVSVKGRIGIEDQFVGET